MASKKVEVFTGIGDVKQFITKCDLYCTLKDYEGEKKAVYIAGKLDETALDVYMILNDNDKKEAEKIKEELLKNFDRAEKNREVAVEKLSKIKRLPEESAEVFSYKIKELVKKSVPKI